MSKKEKFINMVDNLLKEKDLSDFDPEALEYWRLFKNGSDSNEKPILTDTGKMILKFLQDNQDTEMWKAKDIGEGLLISSRTVSGSIRKLCSDGFVEKMLGTDPVLYAITEKGKNTKIL